MPTRTEGPVQTLLDLLEEAFARRSWHGTNLRGSIRGLVGCAPGRSSKCTLHSRTHSP